MLEKLKQYFDNLDKLLSIRGFVAVTVVFFHLYLGHDIVTTPQNKWWSWIYFGDGDGAVQIFFVLSGYLMAKAFLSGRHTFDLSSIFKFWKNRLARIAPLYYFVVLVGVLLYTQVKLDNILDIFNLAKPSILRDTLIFNFYGKPEFGGQMYNTVIWSLSVEMQFYLLVPILSLIILKITKISRWFVLPIILMLFTWTFYKNNLRFDGTNWLGERNFTLLWQLEVFVIGMLIYPLITKFELLRNLASKLYYFTPIILAGAFWFCTNLRINSQYSNYNESIAVVVGFILVYILESKDWQKQGFKKENSLKFYLKNPQYIPEFLGNISFGVYLWHLPVIQNIGKLYPNGLINRTEIHTKVLLVLVFSMLLATYTFYYIENFPKKQVIKK